MSNLTHVSDWHLGAVRSGGTTPSTAYQLRQDLLANGEHLLSTIDNDLLVGGDLFDTSDISKKDLLETYRMFAAWLGKGHMLYLEAGNHDEVRNVTQYSSFDFFAALLVEQFPEQAVLIRGGHYIEKHDVYVLSHVQNQDLLDLELTKVPACRALFLHANYDCPFAINSDHSLSVSEGQARAAPVDHVIFAHEHVGRTELKGKVVIPGNQFPSSISDVLNNDSKRLLVLTDAGIEFIETWRADSDYVELDWRELTDTGARFIRAVGQATAAEAPQVVSAISRFRSTSSALIVGNAVKIEGVNDAEAFTLSHEQVTSFNVRDALREYLTDEDNQKIDKLMEARCAQ